MKLYLTVGLPASGKSTFVDKMMEEADEDWVRVNRDDIRREFFPDPDEPIGYKFDFKNEDKVTEVAHERMRAAFSEGSNVVCDDTNLSKVAIDSLSLIGAEFGAQIEINDSFLEVPLLELLERNRNRERSVPQWVIHRFWDKHVGPKESMKQM